MFYIVADFAVQNCKFRLQKPFDEKYLYVTFINTPQTVGPRKRGFARVPLRLNVERQPAETYTTI